jgi:hypothetical protein
MTETLRLCLTDLQEDPIELNEALSTIPEIIEAAPREEVSKHVEKWVKKGKKIEEKLEYFTTEG